MAHSYGRISKPIVVYPTTGDVEATLGIVGGDVGLDCVGGNPTDPRSGAVNQKSFNKPFDAGYLTEVTMAQRRAFNFGWGNFRGDIGTSLYQVLNAKGAGQTWVWDYPTGGLESPYRILDFDGYQHNAAEPFKMIFEQDEYTTQQPARLIFENADDFIELQNHFKEWAIAGNPSDPNNLGLGIAFASTPNKTNWNTNDTYCLLVGYTYGVAWMDMDNEKNINVPAAFLASLGTGTWYGYPFILLDTRTIQYDATTRRVTGGMTNGGAIMLYQAPIELKITTYNPFDNFSFVLTGTCTGNEIAGTYSNFSLDLTTIISGLSGTVTTQVVSIEIDHAGSSPDQDVTTTLGSASKSNIGNGTHHFTATRSAAVYPIVYDPKGEGAISIRANVVATINGTTYSTTINGIVNIQ